MPAKKARRPRRARALGTLLDASAGWVGRVPSAERLGTPARSAADWVGPPSAERRIATHYATQLGSRRITGPRTKPAPLVPVGTRELAASARRSGSFRTCRAQESQPRGTRTAPGQFRPGSPR